jgi:hypothetical protein
MTASGGLLGICVMLGLFVGLALRDRLAQPASVGAGHVRGAVARQSL